MPLNLIICGVGGQGNVLASKVLGNILVSKGLDVTIGETFGAVQTVNAAVCDFRPAHVWPLVASDCGVRRCPQLVTLSTTAL